MTKLRGSAAYVSSVDLKKCPKCGAGDLAEVKSPRSGDLYLCETMESHSQYMRQSGIRVRAPWKLHKCGGTNAVAKQNHDHRQPGEGPRA